eukprot:c27290_g1_i1 orf=184-1974(+)
MVNLFSFMGTSLLFNLNLVRPVVHCLSKPHLCCASFVRLQLPAFWFSFGDAFLRSHNCPESEIMSSSPANFAAIGNALNLLPRRERRAKISFFWRAYSRPFDTERFTVAVARRDDGRKFQRLKDLSKKGLRELRSPGGIVEPELSSRVQNSMLPVRQKEEIVLRDNEAIGQIASAQANFMRVIVERAGSEPTDMVTTEASGSVSAVRVSPEKDGVAEKSGKDNTILCQEEKWAGEGCLNFNSGKMAMNGVNASSFYVEGTAVACKSKQSQVTAGDDESRLSSELSSHINVTESFKEEEHAVENGYLQASSTHAHKQSSYNDSCCHNANFTNSVIRVPEGVMGLRGEAETTREGLLHGQESMQHESDIDADSKIGMELLCVVRALLKKINQKVMVGDRVLVSGIDWVDRRGMVEQVLERKSELLDPPVANVDQMLILFSMDRPKVEAMTITRFLVEAESTGIPFILVLNKSDLVTHREVDEWEDRLSSWGYRPCFCSVNTLAGVVPLCELLINKTTAIIGPSGTGKSSLINTIGDKAGIKSWSNLVVKHWENEEPEGTLDSLTSDQVSFDEQTLILTALNQLSLHWSMHELETYCKK